ncbi:hypothetical protein OH787_34480 [Streptomyces sp. NBC_01547]|uniref:hypothetical protein n=1 Tax=unclassified Streptomyces TaxID=2593676 RepID=UPI00386DA4B9
MAGELKKVESRYGDSVQKITMGQSWSGISAGAAHTSFAATRYEYSAAQIQAKAIAELLRDNDDGMAAYSAADWKSKMAYHVIGGAVTPLYFTTAGGMSLAIGDSMQRGVDTWAWVMGNNLKAEADVTANAGIADLYLDADNQMGLMVDSWADGRQDINADVRAGLKNAILDGHDRGSNTTHKYLTDTTN